jgi:protein deglycase
LAAALVHFANDYSVVVEAKKAYAAICAAPAVVLATHGLIDGAATCYPLPAFRGKLTNASDQAVVRDGDLTTSQGPATALAFALELGEQLYGKEKAAEIAKQLLYTV